MKIEDYIARFEEEPGYLDYARVGPVGRTIVEEQDALQSALRHARFGSLAPLEAQHDRLRNAVSALTGFPADQVVFQPNTSQGLMHAMFGMTGGVALAASEFPSLTFAVDRANRALGVLTPHWLETDHGRVTPGNLRDQLTAGVTAVAVSLVDYRTGYLADLEGIRQVIGDRLLIVDGSQGFGVVDAPFGLADVVASCGQKWVRAGWGTGFLALSARAIEHLTPVWSGQVAAEDAPLGVVSSPVRGAAAFQLTTGDPVAQGRFAGALEEVAAVGVPVLNAAVADNVSRLLDIADAFAVPVVSPRAHAERAGIVVLEPPADRFTVLAAALHNHGISATARAGTIRLSAHATTEQETFSMLSASLLSYSTAA